MPRSVPPARGGLPRAVARVYLALCAATAAAALAVAASGALAGSLRPSDPHGTLSDAASILATNGRAALIALGCAVLIGRVPGWRPVLDLALGLLAALNTIVVGAAIAAAGPAVAARWLAHVPVEWLGYALPAGAYLLARHARLRPAHVALIAVLALAALTLAALLEALAVPL